LQKTVVILPIEKAFKMNFEFIEHGVKILEQEKATVSGNAIARSGLLKKISDQLESLFRNFKDIAAQAVVGKTSNPAALEFTNYVSPFDQFFDILPKKFFVIALSGKTLDIRSHLQIKIIVENLYLVRQAFLIKKKQDSEINFLPLGGVQKAEKIKFTIKQVI